MVATKPVLVTIQLPAEHHGWVYDWQTLEGGALALLGALATVLVISRQIGSSERQERARVARELMAARAVLPLTLSSLSEWSEACGRILLEEYGTGKIVISPREGAPTLPIVPAEAIRGLERLIAASDDRTAHAVANLVGDIQVFVARMQAVGFVRAEPAPPTQIVLEMDNHIIGIGSICASIAAMFDYARRRSDALPDRLSWEQVVEALNLLGADRDRQRKLYQLIEERERSGMTPGYIRREQGEPAGARPWWRRRGHAEAAAG